MIRLQIEEYCDCCMDFSPDVTPPTRAFSMADGGREVLQTDTIVRCEYRKRCEAIKKYLQRQLTKEEVVG